MVPNWSHEGLMLGTSSVTRGEVSSALPRVPRREVDLSGFSPEPPKKTLDLLFIHHSCGGQLLAAGGSAEGTNAIYKSHPNGGGLRAMLEQNSYKVHEASYASRIGQQ